MKRIYFILITVMLIYGSMNAQENHYVYNYHEFAHKITVVAQININGVEQTSSDFEIGAFDGTSVTGSERIGVYNHYHRAYLAVFYNSGYDVTFKLYNHTTGEELDNCTITYQGEPLTFMWEDEKNYGSNKKPVVFDFTTTQTFTKPITAYTSDKDRYYLIASPIGTVSPEYVTNMLSNNYDLYRFNQNAPVEDGISLEWENYENENFSLEPGKGYLYANSGDDNSEVVDLTFSGAPYSGSGDVTLTKTDNVDWSGWNLIGNPFGTDATLNKPFIRLTDGTYTQVETEGHTVNCMEGVFVQAASNGETVTFTAVSNGDGIEPANISKLNIKVSQVASNRGNGTAAATIDNAIVRFDGGATLGKFMLDKNSTKLYIPQSGRDFAIVNAPNEGELPLNFKAEKNGTYTLSFDIKNVEMHYLHLIDNMTGADVDLLAGASTLRQAQGSATYTFEAKTTNYASRFRLAFNSSDANEAVCEPSFAYFNGSNWMVNNQGKATLQVIDMMGRVLSSETISGNTEININQPAGVYMLRLIDNENVRVQKVVVR